MYEQSLANIPRSARKTLKSSHHGRVSELKTISKLRSYGQVSLMRKSSSFGSMRSKDDEEVDRIIDHHKTVEFKFVEHHAGKKYEGSSKTDLCFKNHAEHNSKCECNVCKIQDKKKSTIIVQRPETAFFKNFNFEYHPNLHEVEKDFVFILKRLSNSRNYSKGLQLFIPETACFSSGECKFIAYTSKDKTIKFIKQKDKLVLHELRKYFETSRLRKDEETMITSPREESGSVAPNVLESKRTTRMDSFVDSVSSINMAKTKRISSMGFRETETFTNKEVGLVRFKDDSATLMSEVEFSNMMLKRKIDPVWKQIQYIQSCLKTKRLIQNATRVYFVYETQKDTPLFSRALSDIRLQNGEIHRVSEDYIPPEEIQRFEEDLRWNNEKEYYLYILIKIYHFLEKFSGIRIMKMGGDFAKDEFGTAWLLNISRVESQSLHLTTHEEAQLHNPDELIFFDSKGGFAKRIEHNYKETERRESVKLLNNILKQHYENIKRIVGVNILEAYYSDHITDEIFSRLHPSAPFKLSDISRSSLIYEEIRDFIISNARKLLYPRSAADNGMTPEALVKYTFSGSIPKSIQGVVIKKSEDVGQTNTQGTDLERQQTSKMNDSKVSSLTKDFLISKSMSKLHANMKANMKANLKARFTNTWWNVKQNVREMYKAENENPAKRELPRAKSNGAIRSFREPSHSRRTENSPLRVRLSTRDLVTQESMDFVSSSSNFMNTVNTVDLDPYQKILLNFKKRPQSNFFRNIKSKAILDINAL